MYINRWTTVGACHDLRVVLRRCVSACCWRKKYHDRCSRPLIVAVNIAEGSMCLDTAWERRGYDVLMLWCTPSRAKKILEDLQTLYGVGCASHLITPPTKRKLVCGVRSLLLSGLLCRRYRYCCSRLVSIEAVQQRRTTPPVMSSPLRPRQALPPAAVP